MRTIASPRSIVGHGQSGGQGLPLEEPVALAVRKPGRGTDGWPVVAKCTFLYGEAILGIAHRHQRGVSTTISIPLVVLEFAEAHGCERLYFRRDLTREAWRIRLEDLRTTGYLGPGAGAELYISVSSMEPVPFPNWLYAEKIVRLEPERKDADPPAQQLTMDGVL